MSSKGHRFWRTASTPSFLLQSLKAHNSGVQIGQLRAKLLQDFSKIHLPEDRSFRDEIQFRLLLVPGPLNQIELTLDSRPTQKRVVCEFRRVGIGLEGIERFQNALQQAVSLRDSRFQDLDGVSLRSEAVVQGGHSLREELLHGRHNLRCGRYIGEFGGVLLEARFDLCESIGGRGFLRCNALFEAGDGIFEIPGQRRVRASRPSLAAGIGECARGDSCQEESNVGDNI